ncbi:CAP domain-containing protein [Streptomyces sp. 71268]|uniref:CAP domain-containing protein n=1 Tax=Streptomyces sp. 71268 TaxID=3002640 RepID=UPI0023F6585B|nr:CAP domain-containing protein [Streptomyces sp. 71268]WEV26427.1 CAP domain-containing protein [Streptomyces sp. 71268]
MSARRRTSSRPTRPAPNTPQSVHQSAAHTTDPAEPTGTTGPVDANDASHDAGVVGARRSHRARRGHRGRAKRRPVWVPLAVAALVAGGGGTAYVALDGSGAGDRSVADGTGQVDRVHIVESASPDASRTPDGADRTPGTPGPSPSKSARPSSDAAKKAERERSSRSAGPRGDADRPGSAAGDGSARDGSADDANDTANDAANDKTADGPAGGTVGKSRPGPATRPGSDAGARREGQGPRDAGRGGTTAEVLALVNEERAEAGCRPLAANGTLNRVADTYAGVMADTRNLSHTGPDGSTVGDRVTRSGYAWSSVGENIARGQADADAVVDAWMKSPGHRANILNCSFRDMGIGVDQDSGGPWWTQVFATGR